jgi:hypothetical protein
LADETAQTPTLEDLRKQIDELKGLVNELAQAGMSKVTDTIRERPVTLALAGIGVGLVAWLLVKRPHWAAVGPALAIIARPRGVTYGSFWPVGDHRQPRVQPLAEETPPRPQEPSLWS